MWAEIMVTRVPGEYHDAAVLNLLAIVTGAVSPWQKEDPKRLQVYCRSRLKD